MCTLYYSFNKCLINRSEDAAMKTSIPEAEEPSDVGMDLTVEGSAIPPSSEVSPHKATQWG